MSQTESENVPELTSEELDLSLVQVFDLTGRYVRNEALAAGVYLVKVGTRPAQKVVVM